MIAPAGRLARFAARAALLSAAIGLAMMFSVGRPAPGCPGIVALELPADIYGFEPLLRRCWTSGAATEEAEFELGPLRWNLFADSFPFVLGYATLFCLCGLLLARGVSWRQGLVRELACFVPIVCAFADWLENGLVIRAAEAIASGSFGPDAVSEIVRAATIKWLLLAATSAQIGLLLLAYRAPGSEARRAPPLRLAAGAAGLASAAACVGGLLAMQGLLYVGIGLTAFAVGFVLYCAGVFRRGS